MAPCLAYSESYGSGRPSSRPGDLGPTTAGQHVCHAPARSPVHTAQSPICVTKPYSEPSLLPRRCPPQRLRIQQSTNQVRLLREPTFSFREGRQRIGGSMGYRQKAGAAGGTREDQECWDAAANGDVRAGRSGKRRK